jgi:hypothetical protein
MTARVAAIVTLPRLRSASSFSGAMRASSRSVLMLFRYA